MFSFETLLKENKRKILIKITIDKKKPNFGVSIWCILFFASSIKWKYIAKGFNLIKKKILRKNVKKKSG